MNAATRGVILAIAAVVLGVIILGQGFDEPGSVTIDAAAPEATATPDPGDGGETDPGDGGATDPGDGGETDPGDGGETAPGDGGETDPGDGGETDPGDGGENAPILHEPSEVRVLVVNGTTVSGAAGTVNNELLAAGYIGLTPTNTEPIGAATASVVYYGEGYELDAAQLAKSLNIPASQVLPVTDDVPVADTQEANVIIILGPDLVPGA